MLRTRAASWKNSTELKDRYKYSICYGWQPLIARKVMETLTAFTVAAEEEWSYRISRWCQRDDPAAARQGQEGG
jgi:hypothetical protein